MSLPEQAAANPDKPAAIMATTEASLSYRRLIDDMDRLARIFRRHSDVGDRIAVLMENELAYFVVVWAAVRAGLQCVPVNWHLHASEIAYIIDNSDAVILVASDSLVERAAEAGKNAPRLKLRLTTGAAHNGFASLPEAMLAPHSDTPLGDQAGVLMFYSSGTTGRPKAIKRPLPSAPFGSEHPFVSIMRGLYGFSPASIYYSPAPLYHAASIGWAQCVQEIGGTVILTERFEPELVLQLIERHRVTHAQFVPTHFVRMLKLPVATRARYDLSSLRFVSHAAAPCPPDVKRQMIDWLGPIIHEYYSATENAGFTVVDSKTWLERPGTVGKPVFGKVHILDPNGVELEPGEIGDVYFDDVVQFAYHKDPEKTAEFFNDRGWGCNGDMGWVDEDGFLYLSDRRNNMIISGGANIYPQECENVLIGHPAVADVVVIGIPNPEYGEEVKAVVELAPDARPATGDLADSLIAYCREKLAHYKCPRSIDFVEELPRLPSGKIRTREIKSKYWGESENLIVR
jgi:long-chain acyl-CoA synthetase